MGLIPGLGRSPGEGNGNPHQIFLPGESHGQRSLAGYSPWGGKDLDTVDHTPVVPESYCFFLLPLSLSSFPWRFTPHLHPCHLLLSSLSSPVTDALGIPPSCSCPPDLSPTPRPSPLNGSPWPLVGVATAPPGLQWVPHKRRLAAQSS